MIRVEVKYFATLAEAAGRLGEEVALEEATVAGLLAELARRYGAEFALLARSAAEQRSSYIVAINGAEALLDDAFATPLADGDRVAIIPPVAGG